MLQAERRPTSPPAGGSAIRAPSVSRGTATRARHGCYVDFDAGSASFRRVAYDLEATQAAILEAGLPRSLAERLAHGI